MALKVELSLSEARRIALAAQRFSAPAKITSILPFFAAIS